MLSKNAPDKTRVVSNSEQGDVYTSSARVEVMAVKVTLVLQMPYSIFS
jgi:hypothetical protein